MKFEDLKPKTMYRYKDTQDWTYLYIHKIDKMGYIYSSWRTHLGDIDIDNPIFKETKKQFLHWINPEGVIPEEAWNSPLRKILEY